MMQHSHRPSARLGPAATTAGPSCTSCLPARPTSCAASCRGPTSAAPSTPVCSSSTQGASQRQWASSPLAGVAPTATNVSWRPRTDDSAAHGENSGIASCETPTWQQGARATSPATGGGSGLMASPMLVAAAATALTLLYPPAGHCSEGLNESTIEVFQHFLDYVESLGSAGPVVFILTVMLFEMVPLFPTQPLSIASGLLFGPVTGALSMLVGMSLAANNAFFVSRGIGRKLAEKVIVMEMGEGHGHGPVATKLAEVQHAIKTGGFWQQLTAITLLRLTPVVPFSASNYMLGLTPVKWPAYVGGTVIGMSAWSVLYAWLGSASRQLLDGGMDLGSVFSDLADRAGKYSSTALSISLGFGVLALIVYVGSQVTQEQERPVGEEREFGGQNGRGVDDADSEEQQQSLYQPAQRKR